MSCAAELRMRALDGADHLAVVGQRRRLDFAHADDPRDRRAPGLALRASPSPATACRSPSPTSRVDKRIERRGGVAEDGGRAPLLRVERVDVDRDDLRLREQRVRAGREVRQARADREHEIGVARERVRGRAAGDADRARLQRMVPRQRALARLRFGDRHAMRLGEARAAPPRRRRCRARRRRRRSPAASPRAAIRAAASSSAGSGSGARMRTSVGAKNASG